jgi:surfactin synthase thioesterase subunit
MVPSAFVMLEALPLSPNGKVDRRALPPPDASPVTNAESNEPANAAEAEIKRIWQEILGVQNIGLDQDFFELGGDSFRGITMMQKLPIRASLMDFLKRPTVRGLAQCCARNQAHGCSLLLQLTRRPKSDAPVLICVPYAGGSAIVYQPLARALGEEMDLRSVMLPGHDFDEQKSNLKPIEEVARMCVEEVRKWVTGPVYLYGHCGGSALTIELARVLELEEIDLRQVFMGAAYPYYFGLVGKMLNGLASRLRSDEYWVDFIRSLGGIGQNAQTADLDFLASAFKHDGACADRYFRKFFRGWPEGRRIVAPVVCIYADDDPLTPSYKTRFRKWELFAQSIELVKLERGGHYFVKGQAETVARIITQTTSSPSNYRAPLRNAEIGSYRRGIVI